MSCEHIKLARVLQPKGYIRGPFGSALRRSELQKSGIPVYEQQHAITSSREFRFYIGNEKYEELKRFTVQANDIIISCSGTIGKVSIIKETDPIGIISQALLILRCNTDVMLSEYLYYFLTSSAGFHSITSVSSGSVQVNIAKRAIIENIDVPYVPLDVQKRVTSILQSIDDKIELNQKINEDLQRQAQIIYEEMFLNTPHATSISGKLSDIATITMGQSPSGSSYNEDGIGTIFFQGRAEFGFRFPAIRLYTTEPKRMAFENDTLMSVRAPVGDLNVAHIDCCIGRGLAAIHSKNNHQSFVLYTMFSLKKQLNVFNGEGTVFGSINRNSLNDMPILIPSDNRIEKFERIVAPMDAIIRNNYDEICRLQEIRDHLLPCLMSGELDVSDLDL